MGFSLAVAFAAAISRVELSGKDPAADIAGFMNRIGSNYPIC